MVVVASISLLWHLGWSCPDDSPGQRWPLGSPYICIYMPYKAAELMYTFWSHCNSNSHPANLVTAVQHDPILLEIFIFIWEEISVKLEKILPICYCRNRLQSLVGCQDLWAGSWLARVRNHLKCHSYGFHCPKLAKLTQSQSSWSTTWKQTDFLTSTQRLTI